MNDYAFVQRGNAVIVVPIRHADGYYNFDLDGHPNYVKDNGQWSPTTLRDFTALLDLAPLPRRMARRWANAREAVGQSPITLRYFARVGAAYAELPLQAVLEGWGTFLNKATALATTTKPGGGTGPNLPGAQKLQTELLSAGVSTVDTMVLVRALAENQNVGHTAQIFHPNIAARLETQVESSTNVIPFVVLSLYTGIQLGSGIGGDVYRFIPQDLQAFLVLGAILFIIVRRRLLEVRRA
ncbi:MAG: hypothetical protein AABX89_07370 [Candidatus Thermoplasmatota archaeon]